MEAAIRELQGEIGQPGPGAGQGRGSEGGGAPKEGPQRGSGVREPEEGGVRGKAALGAKLQGGEDRLKDTSYGLTSGGGGRHWGGGLLSLIPVEP